MGQNFARNLLVPSSVLFFQQNELWPYMLSEKLYFDWKYLLLSTVHSMDDYINCFLWKPLICIVSFSFSLLKLAQVVGVTVCHRSKNLFCESLTPLQTPSIILDPPSSHVDFAGVAALQGVRHCRQCASALFAARLELTPNCNGIK